MRVDFPKKSNVLVQKQKCGISNDVFFCGSGTAEIQVTVYCAKLRNFKSQTVCLRKQNCWTSRHSIFLVRNFKSQDILWAEAELRNFKSQDILCAEAELRDLKSKLLYGSETAKLQVVLNLLYWSHSIFLVRKRNCAISEFQVTHYSVCGSGTLSLSIFLMRRRNFKPKNSPCVEAELQNFKSHNSLCAEAELQVT